MEEVYSFKQVRLRRDGQTTVLNTTVDTVIKKKLDANLKQLVVESATPQEESEPNIKVDSIYSIEELSRFKQCLHCNKKVKQVTASAVIKCDHCGQVVRNSSCKENLMAKFLVQNDNSDERFHHFVIFQEVLQQVIGNSLQTWQMTWSLKSCCSWIISLFITTTKTSLNVSQCSKKLLATTKFCYLCCSLKLFLLIVVFHFKVYICRSLHKSCKTRS